MTDSLSFPDGPRSTLDARIGELIAAANDVALTQSRLRALLRANQDIVAELDLATLLRRIIEAAVELSGARYGALGVIGADGALEQFVHVGMADDDIERIGHLPRGAGLLGALITDPVPIRLTDLSDDSRAAGFPAGHPPMSSFLGVPIRVRGAVYGNLYLTEAPEGFSEEDEQLVSSLAVTAGFVIENARLFTEMRRQAAWNAASATLTARMLETDIDSAGALDLIAQGVLEPADAENAFVLLVGDDPGRIEIAHVGGEGASGRLGVEVPTADSIAARVLQAERGLRWDERELQEAGIAGVAEYGPMLGVPLRIERRVRGVLLVARAAGREPFTDHELAIASDFAAQAAIAVELHNARADRERMLLFEDRGRIARDLHDRVIQELFSTGLQLQSVSGLLPAGRPAERVEEAVERLDDAIQQIRAIIFTLRAPTHDEPRRRIVEVVRGLADRLAVRADVRFSGPVDAVLDADLEGDVLAVASEIIANAVKHGRAASVQLDISVAEGVLTIRGTNDGRAPDWDRRRSGLANLAERAAARGGSLDLTTESGATVVRWSVRVGTKVPARRDAPVSE